MKSFLFLSNSLRTVLRPQSHGGQHFAKVVRGFTSSMDKGAKLKPAARVAGQKQDVWYVRDVYIFQLTPSQLQRRDLYWSSILSVICNVAVTHAKHNPGLLLTKRLLHLLNSQLSTWVKDSLATIPHLLL
jgi:hypothetical protein